MIKKLEKRLSNIYKEFERYSRIIDGKLYNFNIINEEIGILKELKIDEFKQWVNENVYEQRKSLLLQVKQKLKLVLVSYSIKGQSIQGI